MNTRDPYYIVVILILISILFWMWYENGRKGESAALDRNILLKGNEILKADLKASQDSIKAERILRRFNDSTASKKETLARTEINRLKRKERLTRPNPDVITLTDTVFAEYDTALMHADERRKADSTSFEREIKILQGSKLALETAYDSTFNQLLTVNDNLIRTEKKLSKMDKLAKTLGISSGVLAMVAVILAVL